MNNVNFLCEGHMIFAEVIYIGNYSVNNAIYRRHCHRAVLAQIGLNEIRFTVKSGQVKPELHVILQLSIVVRLTFIGLYSEL